MCKFIAANDSRPAPCSADLVLTPEQCAQQFELYASSNPDPERAHAYQHCADFLRKFCKQNAEAQAAGEVE
jgi:hypothetical protein